MAVVLPAKSVVADPLSLESSSSLMMIDGNGDQDTTVSVTISCFAPVSYDFGFVEDGGFTEFSGILELNGGDVLNLARRNKATGEIHTLSDGSAAMTLLNPITPTASEQPVISEVYYGAALIYWNWNSTDFVATLSSHTGDGFKAWGGSSTTTAPEPGSLLLFGLGSLALVFGSRRRRTGSTRG